MKKLYTSDKKRFLAYHKQIGSKNKAPYIIFLHGLMSNMNGHKAIATEKYCQEQGYNFIRFDNFGNGSSSGEFIDQTISDWLSGVNLVIQELTEGPVLLVGSSMGAWLALIAAKLTPQKVIGVITLAAAADFTKELIWDKFTNEEKDIIKKQGIYDVCSNNPECNESYPISYNLIEDSKKYLMLSKLSEKNIDIYCPLHLIHGVQDIDVPYTISLRIAEKVESQKVVVKLIKDANHRLSREGDLLILYNSIEEVLKSIE
ncbi:MAG: alpha/beta hydrolase [Rickettsiales bacterium]